MIVRLSPVTIRCLGVLAAIVLLSPTGAAGAQAPEGRGDRGDTLPTLGLEGGLAEYAAAGFRLGLVRASQTASSLRPAGQEGFDFTPSDWLERRSANLYHHLGDLTLRLREVGSGEWAEYSTAAARRPVTPLPASGRVLAAAELNPTLAAGIPLRVRRYWEVRDGSLALRFELRNEGASPVEIGALGIPMVFNNILMERDLDEAHAVASFHDPYIGRDAGYVQVTRLSGAGPALVVVPLEGTPLEAWRPLLEDRTRRGITFEGFYEWMPHSRAYAEDEWSEAEPWNVPTSKTLAPGESRSYGVRFLLSPGIREIEETLLANERPVAVGVPGYVLPADLDAKLFLKHESPVRAITVEPAGAVTVTPARTTANGWREYAVRGKEWGRARLTVRYEDGIEQTIHYKVIKPAPQVAGDLGQFLTTEQWFEVPDDPFGRSPSVISYDYEARAQVTEDSRAWIAGLGDEGGSGSWLAAIMKQLIQPDRAELAKLERFVDGVLWGGLQYAEGEHEYGVRKSMFYYEPDDMPEGTYSDSIRYGGWSSWNREHAMTVGRSYNYPHVAAAHWVLYRLARNHRGLVRNHAWDWYLERAYRTGLAMVEHAPHYAQFGQMEGTVFVLILMDLQREGWSEQADALEAAMRQRAAVWESLGYPFGSEMPWDSTGQEEVYAWSRYFGLDEKAAVTLNAILAYMPTVPHWGYNGSARRYWDFLYAGKLRRVERQLHHYGSGLNAIPVLTEYRYHPDDIYLLRVGYGGLLGSIANVTREGFGPAAFHAFPSTLRIDALSGDYGPNFLGHALNAATYVVEHPEFGWLAFGGNLAVEGTAGRTTVRVQPRDAARSRVYLAPLGLWITLDAGTFRSVALAGDEVRVTLSSATAHTARALLRVERPGAPAGAAEFAPVGSHATDRGAWVIPLTDAPTEIVLRPGS
ncbi:MAG: hypothetical protein KY466_01790 [Gemmatimonadetes bacterium]|nr:hypothetical protein [Gemmatimonadota bacterium]